MAELLIFFSAGWGKEYYVQNSTDCYKKQYNKLQCSYNPKLIKIGANSYVWAEDLEAEKHHSLPLSIIASLIPFQWENVKKSILIFNCLFRNSRLFVQKNIKTTTFTNKLSFKQVCN